MGGPGHGWWYLWHWNLQLSTISISALLIQIEEMGVCACNHHIILKICSSKGLPISIQHTYLDPFPSSRTLYRSRIRNQTSRCWGFCEATGRWWSSYDDVLVEAAVPHLRLLCYLNLYNSGHYHSYLQIWQQSFDPFIKNHLLRARSIKIHLLSARSRLHWISVYMQYNEAFKGKTEMVNSPSKWTDLPIFL